MFLNKMLVIESIVIDHRKEPLIEPREIIDEPARQP